MKPSFLLSLVGWCALVAAGALGGGKSAEAAAGDKTYRCGVPNLAVLPPPTPKAPSPSLILVPANKGGTLGRGIPDYNPSTGALGCVNPAVKGRNITYIRPPSLPSCLPPRQVVIYPGSDAVALTTQLIGTSTATTAVPVVRKSSFNVTNIAQVSQAGQECTLFVNTDGKAHVVNTRDPILKGCKLASGGQSVFCPAGGAPKP